MILARFTFKKMLSSQPMIYPNEFYMYYVFNEILWFLVGMLHFHTERNVKNGPGHKPVSKPENIREITRHFFIFFFQGLTATVATFTTR